MPFNIPIEYDGISLTGKHDITIEVTYKDSMRDEHSLSYDTTIDVSGLTLLDSNNDDMPAAEIITIIIIVGIIGVLYKKGKLPIINKKSQ